MEDGVIWLKTWLLQQPRPRATRCRHSRQLVVPTSLMLLQVQIQLLFLQAQLVRHENMV